MLLARKSEKQSKVETLEILMVKKKKGAYFKTLAWWY